MEKIESCGRDQKKLFKVTNHLLGVSQSWGHKRCYFTLWYIYTSPSSEIWWLFRQQSWTIRNGINSSASSISLSEASEEEQSSSSSNILTEFRPVTIDEVKRIILQIPNKNCELDPIPTWLLNLCIDDLVELITKLINSSLESSYVPRLFKGSYVKPLLKKPGLDKNELKNYRPVSNLPFVSKVLEKVVDVQMEQHLSENRQHELHQAAYRKFHSTETALLKVQNDILKSLDMGNITILVLLDLSAVFDTIDHGILLHHLEQHFHISGKPLAWMKSYLTQSFYINGVLSDPVLMKYSVPQGSVLGPKNCVMYTKPVGTSCRRHDLDHHFYADDLHLYLSFKHNDNVSRDEAVRRVELCLNDIIHWMNHNMLKLNADKTELIVFTPKNHLNQIADISSKVCSSEVKSVMSVRNLGAFFESQINMESHINSVCRSCYSQLRQIWHIRQYLKSDATKSLSILWLRQG